MVMLRVTAGAGAGAGAGASAAAVGAGDRKDEDEDEEGEKELYLRSLPRPESGRGPATVSSQSWSRRPIPSHKTGPLMRLIDWPAGPACGCWTDARGVVSRRE